MKKDINSTSNSCNSTEVSALIDCSHGSDDNRFVFSVIWISLNVVQFSIILALLLFIFVKLDVRKNCALLCVARVEKNEKKVEKLSDDYLKPRSRRDPLPLPIPQICRIESIIYEDIDGPQNNKPNSAFMSFHSPSADKAIDYENIAMART
jgi:hypothetical protein